MEPLRPRMRLAADFREIGADCGTIKVQRNFRIAFRFQLLANFRQIGEFARAGELVGTLDDRRRWYGTVEFHDMALPAW